MKESLGGKIHGFQGISVVANIVYGGGGGFHSNTANQLWRDQVSFVVREPKFSHPTPLLGD